MIVKELPVIPYIEGDHSKPPCDKCNAACCRYWALNIAKPTEPEDFDHYRWVLLHENVEIYEDTDGEWYVQVYAPCSKLDSEGNCSIYATRPILCQDYGYGEDGEVNCEAVVEVDPARHYRTGADMHERFKEWYRERFGIDFSKKIVKKD